MGFCGLSNGAGNNFWALPIFEKHDIEVRGGGVLTSCKANANFFPGLLKEIWLVPDLWALYGLFRYAPDDPPPNYPWKVINPLKNPKSKIFFQ